MNRGENVEKYRFNKIMEVRQFIGINKFPKSRFLEKTLFHLSKNHGITIAEVHILLEHRKHCYDLHGNQMRDNRTLYARHPDRVAMLTAMNGGNLGEIKLAYLHDLIEEGAYPERSGRKRVTHEYLEKVLSDTELARQVALLSEPKVVNKKIVLPEDPDYHKEAGSKDEESTAMKEMAYIRRILSAPAGTLFVKLFDIEDNRDTLKNLPIKQQLKALGKYSRRLDVFRKAIESPRYPMIERERLLAVLNKFQPRLNEDYRNIQKRQIHA